MGVPESVEVIEQTAHHLSDLYRRLVEHPGKRIKAEFSEALMWLSADRTRAFRVALCLGQWTVVPLRATMDLDDPEVGLRFMSMDDLDPEEGEVAAGEFLNYLLRSDYDGAIDTFGDLVAVDDDQEIRNFLALVLAVACLPD